MSPIPNRQLARRDSASNSKPYTKVFPANLTDDSQAIMHSSLTQSPGDLSIPGFPTYAQYKHIESTYLTTLSPKKREKALITQVMFDKIWDTLQDPDSRIDSPQFRFWVRKMFRLSNPNDVNHSGPNIETETVVIHNNRPVAIQEQLYELICYCHGRANHGGRDRTRSVVREHYSWVPKELVAQFVKICPTCTIRRSGNPIFLVAAVEKDQQEAQEECKVRFIPFRSQPASDSLDGIQLHWPPSRGPLDSPSSPSRPSRPESEFLSMPHAFIYESGKNVKESALTHDSVNLPHPALTPYSSSSTCVQSLPELQSHSMSREVSLYKGLPNGWQYHSDYPEAYQAHMQGKGRVINPTEGGQRQKDKRPRVPSVAPLRDVNFSLLRSISAIESGAERTLTLPPVLQSFSEGTSEDNSLPPSLRGLLVFEPELEFEKQGPYVPQIDPLLLVAEGDYADSHDQLQALKAGPEYTCESHTTPDSPAKVHGSFPTPTKSRRPVPPTLDLSTASLKPINFKDLADLTSPFASGVTPSTGSSRSCYSQLSQFPMISPSGLSELSPWTSTSTLPSPSEERTRIAKELADGLQLSSRVECEHNFP